MRINDILVEFAPSGDGDGSGDYFQALASAWYNGTFDSGSLQKGIKSQQDVEQLLQRGIIGPDGVTRKYGIDYNSTFDGVVISSDDYYEHADHDETDSRTGKPFGPYDYMEFSDEQLDEDLTEFAADSNDGGEDDALRNYARMWWAGDEATQMQIERALAKMGWEIGEDEGGYDNGGVFVVRAGDENGNSYTSWAAEDLTEVFARRPRPRNSFRSAQIGYTPDGPLPMADYSKYPTAVIMKAIKDLNQDREKNPELIKLLTKELFKRRQQQGVAEGEVTKTSTGIVHKATDKYGADDVPFNHHYAKDARDLDTVNKQQVKDLDASMGITWRNRGTKGVEVDEGDLNEKSTSQAQFRTMAAAAHDPEFARKVGIKQSVAREFNRADTGQDYKDLPKKADESKQAPAEKEADYGADYQDMVSRVKKLAGLGPLKTVYDPQKRVYKNMPTATQPKKEQR